MQNTGLCRGLREDLPGPYCLWHPWDLWSLAGLHVQLYLVFLCHRVPLCHLHRVISATPSDIKTLQTESHQNHISFTIHIIKQDNCDLSLGYLLDTLI